MTTPFRVEAESVDGVRAFRVVGELDQATAPGLSQPLMEAIEAGAERVLVDLTDCEFIDSTGLAILVEAHERTTEGARGFAICCSNSQVQRLLQITGIDRAMDLHPTRDAALAALRG
jgi:anti-sigma B factor antagonist